MITCYLDSQDYSTLTAPSSHAENYLKIRQDLMQLAQEGTIKFVYSGVAISECVSLTHEAVHLAERRAELLSELCANNAFVSMDRLLHSEARALANKCDVRIDMLDPNGNWFPEITDLEPTESPLKILHQRAKNELAGMGLNREQRRAAKKKLKGNSFRTYMDSLDIDEIAKDMIKQYPMKPEHMNVVVKYMLGQASEEDFINALIVSLRDPRWMMKWFTINHESSSSITEIVRKPGREMSDVLRKKIQLAKDWAMFQQENELEKNPIGKKGTITEQWMESQDELLVDMIRRSLADQNIVVDTFTASGVEKFCPGISTMLRSLFSSAWDNVGGSRIELPSNSQPVDALHAMYAPYVDIFRADKYMAPHIQKNVKKYGTVVVSKLTDLVEVLHRGR